MEMTAVPLAQLRPLLRQAWGWGAAEESEGCFGARSLLPEWPVPCGLPSALHLSLPTGTSSNRQVC